MAKRRGNQKAADPKSPRTDALLAANAPLPIETSLSGDVDVPTIQADEPELDALVHPEVDEAEALRESVLEVWQDRPAVIFKDFCTCAITTMEFVAATHWDAKHKDPQTCIVDLCPNIDRFGHLLALGKAIWESGLVNGYFARTEVVRASRYESPSRYDGSCYHELALRFGEDLSGALDARISGREYCALLRYHTARGEFVNDYLQSLRADIRCESQVAIEKWQAELNGESVEGNAQDWRALMSAVAEPGVEDGPAGVDSFFWQGKRHLGLTKKPFLLLSALWTARHQTLSLIDAEMAVYGSVDEAPEHGLSSIRREANAFFAQQGIPLSVTIQGGTGAKVALRTARTK